MFFVRNITLKILLLLSVATNAVLLFRGNATRATPDPIVSPAARPIASPPLSVAPPGTTDPAAFAVALRSTSLPERLIRSVLAAEIDEKFRDREAVLLPPKNKTLEWWQSDNTPVPLASRLALLALHREKSRLRVELLGPDPDAPDDGSSLPPAKREAVRLLAADYDETVDAIEHGGISERFLLPAEKAALASLKEQQKTELAALLTPAELADFELRTSSITEDIRDELHGFDATDQEFTAIYEFWKKENSGGGFFGHNLFFSEEEIAAPLKAILGDERFAEFRRAGNYEFGKIRSLVQRAGLPPETAAQVYDLRVHLEQESTRIVDDDSLSVAEKLAALQKLARETRAGIGAKLGPDAAAAYLPNAEKWLSLVDRGDGIHFLSHGWIGTGVSLPPPPPAPAEPR